MRKTITADGVSVKAYAGSTGVLLAMDIDPQLRKGLLGFAIERMEGGSAQHEWLAGMLNFSGKKRVPGELIPSNEAPLQKFRWSEYRVHSGRDYTYIVHPVYGTPDKLDVKKGGPTIRVQTESTDLRRSTGTPDEHLVLFNRAAAASQAFSRKFSELAQELTKKVKAKKVPKALPPEAMEWLSRGVLDQITGFIALAEDQSWAVDVAIYQYELAQIVDAVNAALDRGVAVRLIYHAKPGDPQTAKNQKSAAHLPKADNLGRVTKSIFHHKFIVLSKLSGATRKPQAVLCGSTNFTENGVYRQANVVHVTTDAGIAAKYLEQFEFLFGGADPNETRKHDTEQNVLDPADLLQVGFSPRSGQADLDLFVTLINAAKRDVLFSTAFNMSAKIYDALAGHPHDPVLRYGIQDKKSKITGLHADRTADFEAAALLPAGLEGWLKETTAGQKGNILIHTKVIVVDFTSDSPVVISGSHNFSPNASASNDENYIIFRGNTDVADCYGCEVLRIYDHYRFRYIEKEQASKGKAKPPTLTPDDGWTADYFNPAKLKYADRVRFSGAT